MYSLKRQANELQNNILSSIIQAPLATTTRSSVEAPPCPSSISQVPPCATSSVPVQLSSDSTRQFTPPRSGATVHSQILSTPRASPGGRRRFARRALLSSAARRRRQVLREVESTCTSNAQNTSETPNVAVSKLI